MIPPSEIRVSVDVGCYQHSVAVGLPNGELLDEFDIKHDPTGFSFFFNRIEAVQRRFGSKVPVSVAMEGYNGHARPLDTLVRLHEYRLFNVNNLKLARFKEIFPAAAKSDPIDARKGLELFQLKEHLPLAKDVLQEVAATPAVNDKLKRLMRRRRSLVDEKGRVINRLQTDLRAVCPDLLAITRDVENKWFLNFLTHSDDIGKLARLQIKTIRSIRGVGDKYTAIIQNWQATAQFSHELPYVGPMILEDAQRVLGLVEDIKRLETECQALMTNSEIASHINTIPGFAVVCASEMAGEIGTIDRFTSEASLALYLGMANLTHSSGKQRGSRPPNQVNQRAKAAMMTGIDRHRKQVAESQRFYEKKRAEGKKHNQAIRALGRHLCRVIFKMLKQNRDYEIR
jgi:transposase